MAAKSIPAVMMFLKSCHLHRPWWPSCSSYQFYRPIQHDFMMCLHCHAGMCMRRACIYFTPNTLACEIVHIHNWYVVRTPVASLSQLQSMIWPKSTHYLPKDFTRTQIRGLFTTVWCPCKIWLLSKDCIHPSNRTVNFMTSIKKTLKYLYEGECPELWERVGEERPAGMGGTGLPS